MPGDSRWMPAASSWVGSLSRVICQVIFPLFFQVQLEARAGFLSKIGFFWVSHHIYSSKSSFLNKTQGQEQLSCTDKTALCPVHGTANLPASRHLHHRLLTPVSSCVPRCEEG